MRWYQKLLWGCVGIVLAFALVGTIYGMGSNLVEVFPLWLTSSIIGLVALITITLLASIFATGIIRIKEIFKEG